MNNYNLDQLIQYALRSGADRATVISAGDLVITAGLADKCAECPNYGLAKSCPPHVVGPVALIKELETFHQAIVFRIDVPSKDLFSEKRREIFQQLHKAAARIEQTARQMGFIRAKSFAGGSCKELFCYDYKDCAALSNPEKCRFPQHARPSMSGFGIDVARLFESAAWTLTLAHPQDKSSDSKIANVCGLVLSY